jgi:enediyne polyketide synthase
MSAAILSLACRYPDAATPETLWQNVLEGRRAFRAIPSERFALARYAAAMVGEADSVTAVKAGLLTDWQFDCDRFRIPQSTFAAADLSHWLALEVAADAIANAGGVHVLDRERTAVVVANTLTGEFSRAALLRLRAPFLDEILAEAGEACGLDDDRARELRRHFGAILRGRFPEPTEESLAGALANTIAGRIANHFDLHGGAYSVDGACASSLVAVADAANLLALGQVDAVLVGAVDLSLDPFELVGFSRNGALSHEEMRVFDQRSSGFWPGEGAGFLLLMRDDEARRRGLRVRATLRGWGISSDGAGGLTRPSVDGQLRALRRAHEMAATDPADIFYVEAHGTGTSVGDAIEVTALARWRNGSKAPLPIGSIKANIGHTKAAAGLAGLIKTVGVLSQGCIPPHVGCTIPHRIFKDVNGAIRPALEGEAWPAQSPRLAGVSCFGFGGINAHVVLECGDGARSVSGAPRPHRVQNAELFVFAASDRDALAARMVELQSRVATLSLAEFTDAAAECARIAVTGPCRAAIVAREPDELADRMQVAIAAVRAGHELIDSERGIHVAQRTAPPRIGLLFPGQAAPSRPHGGLWAHRFDRARAATAAIPPAGGDAVRTEIAQPAIVAASITACRVLEAAGLEAAMAAGHSLGELTALAWAGAIEDEDLLKLAATRGAIMARYGRAGGTMLRIAAGAADVASLIGSIGLAHELAVACRNGPHETVIAGPTAAIAVAAARARGAGLDTTALSVSHAFHSAMIAPAVPPFVEALADVRLKPLQRPVASTVTGTILAPDADLREVLARQLTAAVEFEPAVRRLQDSCDVLIEVGPGSGLSRLARELGATAISVDAFAESLAPLLSVLGAAHALGATLQLDVLFADRPTRPIRQTPPLFLTNPCGSRTAIDAAAVPMIDPHGAADPDQTAEAATSTDIFALVRRVIAEETGFAADKIQPDDRFLDDLHLNSLAVSRIAAKAARLLSCSPPMLPGELARGTPRTLASALAELSALSPEARGDRDRVEGVRPWVRPFAVRWAQAERSSTVRVSAWDVLPIQAAPDDRGAIDAIANRPGPPDGLLVWLGAAFDDASTHELFAACRTAWTRSDIVHLAICHAGAPVSAFAQALALEGRFQSVAVVERPTSPDAAGLILDELEAAPPGFSETRLEAPGLRWVPELVRTTPPCRPDAGIGRHDVVLAIGGAKGIGAECALRIGERFGAALILVGRTPANDPAVIATLARAAASGIRCRYVTADVCDEIELTRAVAAASEFGPVTVLLHAAGLNDPAPFDKISDEELRRILAPKTAGLHNAIAAAGARLRRIITFGSILGRIGLHGETHYGIANAWQSVIAARYAREHCHVLSLEWSVWNGIGMGHRLGSIERLARLGVDALPVDTALDTFEELVRDGAVGTIVVTSRFGLPPHLSGHTPALPLLRFVDNVLLHYPGVELIVETELSRGRDPYLADHRINGITVFPGVLALEAMAQVACALGGWASPTMMEAIAFSQAIVVPDDGTVPIRIMALADDDKGIEVVIRSGEDSFASDRMRATFTRDPASTMDAADHCAVDSTTSFDARPLYGPLFFHGERFRCIRNYRHLAARRVAATLSRPDDAACFSQFEPQQLVLGDPFLHDALLHGLQAAAPHRVLIPVSIGRISRHAATPPARMEAVERDATDDTFLFDIITRDDAGAIVEHWQQVTFRAIAAIDDIDAVLATTPELMQAYVERVARSALSDASIEVALICDRNRPRDTRRSGALADLGLDGLVFSRTDGRPVLSSFNSQTSVSIAHRDAVTLAVRASGPIGCDIERVADWARPDALLPLSASMAALATRLAGAGEPPASAAARVWSLCEAAAKHAQPSEQRWTQRGGSNGVTVFEAASGQTMTMHLPGADGGLMIAIATRKARPPIVIHAFPSLQEKIA